MIVEIKKHLILSFVSLAVFLSIAACIVLSYIPGSFLQNAVLVQELSQAREYVTTEASAKTLSLIQAILYLGGAAIGFFSLFHFGSYIELKEKQAKEHKTSR